MNNEHFAILARLLKEHSGLLLNSNKLYLVESRLRPVAERWDFASVRDLVRSLGPGARGDAYERLLADVIEAMTTNESFFFRDKHPFELFRTLAVPRLMQRRATSRRLAIWSAACSSGQEPYSLAMVLREMGAQLGGWSIRILATDISRAMLEKAREGLYTQFEVQRGVPEHLLQRYFQQERSCWRLDADIRRMVEFRPFNLLYDPRELGSFDVVFCRNVLIYFDEPRRAAVLDGVANVLASDGYLSLGGAETVLGISERFVPVTEAPGFYVPGPRADTASVEAAS